MSIGWRALAATLVLGALSGCREPLGACERDSDCGAGAVCDPEVKLCFAQPCTTACDACSMCRAGSCEPRFDFQLTSPTPGQPRRDAAVALRAQLAPRSSEPPEYPEALTYRVRTSGGDPVAEGALAGSGGVYTGNTSALPEGGYSVEVSCAAQTRTAAFSVDTTPPVVSASVALPTRDARTGFAFLDPQLGTTRTWRRDETAVVRVTSSEAIDAAASRTLVEGHAGGASVQAGPLRAVTPCAQAACAEVGVEMWRPGLDAFRGTFAVTVTVADAAGNTAEAMVDIPVTRWKWAFSTGGSSINVTPAIGQRGILYFGTSPSATSGELFALAPEGRELWSKNLGAIAGSPSVGSFSNGTETLYVAAKSGTGVSLYALAGETGVERKKCPGTGTYGTGTVLGAMALLNTPVETAVTVYNESAGQLVAIRPGAAAGEQCEEFESTSPEVPITTPGGSLVTNGTDLFFPMEAGGVASYAYGFDQPRSGWPVPISFSVRGLALVGSDLVAAASGAVASQGGLFRAPLSGGVATLLFPEAPISRLFNLVVDENNVSYFGNELSGARITSVPLATGAPVVSRTAPGIYEGAFVLGRGGLLYGAPSSNARVRAYSRETLQLLWEVNAGDFSAAKGSLTLDCSRDAAGTPIPAEHGVLYVPGTNGKLYAVVVDSRGLEPTAAWPKYQRDARNTGNIATPASSCP